MYSQYVRETFLICFITIIISGQTQLYNEQAICDEYNLPEIKWTCKIVYKCKFAQNILNTGQQHICGYEKRGAKICCPEATKEPPSNNTSTKNPLPNVTVTKNPLPNNTATNLPQYIQIIDRKCNDYAQVRYQNSCVGGFVWGSKPVCSLKLDCVQTESLIVGGVPVKEKELPHMALIGYGEDIKDISWACGGSLISERFVISAAHCNSNGVLGPAKWVALGLLLRREVTPEKIKKNIFRITNVFDHPLYKAPLAHYDITLYQLEIEVPFSPTIRPICLHTKSVIPPELTKNVIISGWGITDPGDDVSEKLLKAVIRILPNETCVAPYASDSHLPNGFDGKVMVCAGHENKRKDTCWGDSGGPLQIISQGVECMYSQVGITSIGSSWCGDYTPAIYTRVSAYLEWIQGVVWPQGV